MLTGEMIGEYRIEGVLGRGGMGAVYEAIHPLIDKRAAVKIIHRDLCENDESVARFQQEAKAVNRIGHPNIVDVFGYGMTEDGRAYLIMELLVGEPLSAWLAADRAPGLSVQSTCDILIEVSHALEAAHGAGVLHRDLKPDNIFLAQARGGQTIVKLLDFGIAKLGVGEDVTKPSIDYTQPGVFVGTPKYIAPEQARGLTLAGSADIYALGAVTFELLAGRAPFVGVDAVELIAKHVTMQAPLPSVFNPALPAIADVLCSQMLDKDPGRRPTIQQVRAMLEQLKTAPARDPKDTQDPARDRATEIIAAPAAPGHAPAAAASIGVTGMAGIAGMPSVTGAAALHQAGAPLPGLPPLAATATSQPMAQSMPMPMAMAQSQPMAQQMPMPAPARSGAPWWTLIVLLLGVVALGMWLLGHVVDRNDDVGPPAGAATTAAPASTLPTVQAPPPVAEPSVTPIAPVLDAAIQVELQPEIDAAAPPAIAIDPQPPPPAAGTATGSDAAAIAIDPTPPGPPPTAPATPSHGQRPHVPSRPAQPRHNQPIPPIITNDAPDEPATPPPVQQPSVPDRGKPTTTKPKKPSDDDAIESPFSKKKSP